LAPPIGAQEKGLFAKHGLTEAAVVKHPSWGMLRDNIASGAIDGAHILSPLAYSIHTGKAMPDGKAVPMTIPPRLNLNGQAIGVPPPLTVRNVKIDAMDTLCVGDPWDAHLVNRALGCNALGSCRVCRWWGLGRRCWAAGPSLEAGAYLVLYRNK
jgi:ABC-type nitrate/sulfonate/bicarbonate transport system substrate-binding protein